MRNRSRTRKSTTHLPFRGVTLIELLVVVTVITALAAILMPALHSARHTARTIACTNNQRQVGLSFLMYADSHNDRFPHAHGWPATLAPFLDDIYATYICPHDKYRSIRLTFGTTTYVVNQYVSKPTPRSALRLRKLLSASRTISFMEGNGGPAGSGLRHPEEPDHDHIHNINWFNPTNIRRGRVWLAINWDIDPEIHSQSANFLFVDGHVEPILSDSIRAWADDGYDFALPSQFPK